MRAEQFLIEILFIFVNLSKKLHDVSILHVLFLILTIILIGRHLIRILILGLDLLSHFLLDLWQHFFTYLQVFHFGPGYQFHKIIKTQ